MKVVAGTDVGGTWHAGWLFSSTPGTASSAAGASAAPMPGIAKAQESLPEPPESDTPDNQEIHPETPEPDAPEDQEVHPEASTAEEVLQSPEAAVSEEAHSQGEL